MSNEKIEYYLENLIIYYLDCVSSAKIYECQMCMQVMKLLKCPYLYSNEQINIYCEFLELIKDQLPKNFASELIDDLNESKSSKQVLERIKLYEK